MKKQHLLLLGISLSLFGCRNIITSPIKQVDIKNNRYEDIKIIENSNEVEDTKIQESEKIVITFGSKKSIISQTFYEELSRFSIKINKKEFLEKKIIISGFTDLDEDEDFNLKYLSIERARSVQKFLVQNSIQSKRIYIEGYQKRYLNSNTTAIEKAENRRVEIKVLD